MQLMHAEIYQMQACRMPHTPGWLCSAYAPRKHRAISASLSPCMQSPTMSEDVNETNSNGCKKRSTTVMHDEV